MSEPLLEIRGLVKSYGSLVVLDGASMEIREGSTLALVGTSGAGKSTLARIAVRLEEADAGEIRFEGEDVRRLSGPQLLPFRARVQLVFQDGAATLNPRLNAMQLLTEPLEIQQIGSRAARRARVLECLEQVGLTTAVSRRCPGEFSGGQRQRLVLARALVLRPSLLILDEALTGLDLSVRAQIVNLMAGLQERHGLTYLHITHDLALAERIADRILTIQRGRIFERGAA